jgi:hypothetical protein
MTTKTDLSNDSYNRAKVSLTLTESSYNADTNTSVVSYTAAVQDGNSSWGGYNYSEGSWSVVVDGVTKASASGKSYDFGSGVISSPYFPRSTSSTITVVHDDDGSASITASITFDGNSNPAGVASTSWTSASPFVLTTFTSPGIPTSEPTLTRSGSSPTTISATSAGSLSGSASITKYQYRYSTDNATWSSGIDFTDPSKISGPITGLTSTQKYYVQTRAVSYASASWGYGGWSSSASIAGIPTAPGTPSISNVVANSLTLTWTVPSSDGGATVSSYKVQATTDNGTTWTTIKTGIAGLTTNLTGLTIAATYKFRIIAVNSTGDSDAGTASDAQFISAYGYRYDGSNPVPITSAKIYVGVGGPGADANGFRTVQSVQKYTASGWQPLET